MSLTTKKRTLASALQPTSQEMGSSSPTTISIYRKGPEEAIPYPLLLLADPSKTMVDSYLGASAMYIATDGAQTLGVYVLYPHDNHTAEIKNIAVAEAYQGKGIGKMLLQHATHTARKNGYKLLRTGTANASIGQMYLYQKQGFDIITVVRDFFTDHYPWPIFENGIQCRHLIILEKIL